MRGSLGRREGGFEGEGGEVGERLDLGFGLFGEGEGREKERGGGVVRRGERGRERERRVVRRA